MVEKIARNAAVEWRKMNYLDKTPYYLLADEAKKRKKRGSRKRGTEEYKFTDWDSPMMVVPRRKFENYPLKMKSDTDIEENTRKKGKIQKRRKSEVVKRKKSLSSMESDTVLTSDVEEMDFIVDASEKDLKQRKFWPEAVSESSFGLSTSNSGGTMEILPSESSEAGDAKSSLRKQ